MPPSYPVLSRSSLFFMCIVFFQEVFFPFNPSLLPKESPDYFFCHVEELFFPPYGFLSLSPRLFPREHRITVPLLSLHLHVAFRVFVIVSSLGTLPFYLSPSLGSLFTLWFPPPPFQGCHRQTKSLSLRLTSHQRRSDDIERSYFPSLSSGLEKSSSPG